MLSSFGGDVHQHHVERGGANFGWCRHTTPVIVGANYVIDDVGLLTTTNAGAVYI